MRKQNNEDVVWVPVPLLGYVADILLEEGERLQRFVTLGAVSEKPRYNPKKQAELWKRSLARLQHADFASKTRLGKSEARGIIPLRDALCEVLKHYDWTSRSFEVLGSQVKLLSHPQLQLLSVLGDLAEHVLHGPQRAGGGR